MLHEMSNVHKPVESEEERIRRISTDEFQETYQITCSWISSHMDLQQMHEVAVEDYIASRHAVLELGLLHTGLSLAAQAVEKFLKCYLLSCGLPIQEVRKRNHKLQNLLNDASNSSGQTILLSYKTFCEDLEKLYNSRYPDSSNPATQWMRDSVHELDRMVCYLEENLPIPIEVMHLKYGGGNMGHEWSSIFVRLFSETSSQHMPALFRENEVLISRFNELQEKFLKHRLASMIPANTLIEGMDNRKRMQEVIRKYS